MHMGLTDALVHMTVRIECQLAGGKESSGTGFIFNFCERGKSNVPAIITNKHVVAGAESGVFHMTLKGEDGAPRFGHHMPVRVNNFESGWVPHPDPSIDLAAFLLGRVLNAVKGSGKEFFYKAASKQLVANSDFMKELTAVENILMVGYPNGLWDTKNNLPIVRRGITATPPYMDFEGRPELLIDCACFPGSSGSPVMLCDTGAYVSKNGNVTLGGRARLLGVLWGGPCYVAEGQVKAVPVPTAVEPTALSRIPNNLGYCIKAEQLLRFEEMFEQIFQEVLNEERQAHREAAAEPAA